MKASASHIRVLGSVVASEDAVLTVDNRGTILQANIRASEILQTPLSDLIGMPFGFPIQAGAKADLEIVRDGRVCIAEMRVQEVLLHDQIVHRVSITDVTDRHEHFEGLKFEALHDGLTSLPNRTYISRCIQEACEEHAKEGFAILYIDLDRFKLINDTFGHHGGDELLRELARRLVSRCGPQDLPARIGGDEFLVLIRGDRPRVRARSVAAAIRRAFQQPFHLEGQDVDATGTVGLAKFPSDGTSMDELIASADSKVYQQKDSRARRLEMVERRKMVTEGVEWSSRDLARDVAAGQLKVIYQPQVFYNRNEIAVEALCRWDHHRLGTLEASEFLEMAQRSALILSIDETVLSQACRQMSLWRQANMPILRTSVNLSRRTMMRRDLVELVGKILRSAELPPSCLEIEIPDSLDLDPTILKRIRQLREHGVRITVDDFGAGKTSLHWLRAGIADCIKIDRTYIRDCHRSEVDFAILEAIIRMAHILNIDVVAAGVENGGQLERLRLLGCDAVQGFYIGHGAEASDLRTFALKRNSALQVRDHDHTESHDQKSGCAVL